MLAWWPAAEAQTDGLRRRERMWEAILEPLKRIAELAEQHWSTLAATLVVLIVGWLVARLLKVLIVRGLRVIRIDVVAQKAGIDAFLQKGGLKQDAVDILGALVYWILMITLLIIIMRIWNIEMGLSNTLVPFLPKIFVSLVVLILGLYIASFVGDLVRTAAANAEMMYATILGHLIQWIIVIFVVLTALRQLGIETELISWGFLLILGMFCLGGGLALGLGAKDIVARHLNRLIDKAEKEQPKK
jgi:hypothetical protein